MNYAYTHTHCRRQKKTLQQINNYIILYRKNPYLTRHHSVYLCSAYAWWAYLLFTRHVGRLFDAKCLLSVTKHKIDDTKANTFLIEIESEICLCFVFFFCFYRQFMSVQVYVVIFMFIGFPFSDVHWSAHGWARRFYSIKLIRRSSNINIALFVSLFLFSCRRSAIVAITIRIKGKPKRTTRHSMERRHCKRKSPIAKFSHYD